MKGQRASAGFSWLSTGGKKAQTHTHTFYYKGANSLCYYDSRNLRCVERGHDDILLFRKKSQDCSAAAAAMAGATGRRASDSRRRRAAAESPTVDRHLWGHKRKGPFQEVLLPALPVEGVQSSGERTKFPPAALFAAKRAPTPWCQHRAHPETSCVDVILQCLLQQAYSCLSLPFQQRKTAARLRQQRTLISLSFPVHGMRLRAFKRLVVRRCRTGVPARSSSTRPPLAALTAI